MRRIIGWVALITLIAFALDAVVIDADEFADIHGHHSATLHHVREDASSVANHQPKAPAASSATPAAASVFTWLDLDRFQPIPGLLVAAVTVARAPPWSV